MKKRELAELALSLGLSFDGSHGGMTGVRRGYAFYLRQIDGRFAIFFSVRSTEGHASLETLDALTLESALLPDYDTAGLCVAYQIAVDPDSEDLSRLLEQAIEECVSFFERQGLVSACERTGLTDQVELYQIDGHLFFLTPSSYEWLMSRDRKNSGNLQARSSQKEHYLLGVIGAFLTSFVGASLLFFFVGAGRLMVYIAIFVVLFSLAAYRILAKKLSLFGIVVAFLFALGMSLAAFQLSYANAFYQGDRPLWEALDAINQAAVSGQLDSSYWFNICLLLGACMLAAVIGSRSIIKEF